MDEWRSDPTWRHEERLFTDGQPTPYVRDEGVETMDIEGAGMVSRAAAPATAPAPPVTPVVDDDTRIRPERDRRRETTTGFDDDTWTSTGAESTFDLHGTSGAELATTPAAGYGGHAAGPMAPVSHPGSPVGFVPGDAPRPYEPPPLPPLEEVEDPDIVGAVFPGATWSAPPTGALRSLSALGPLPDPTASMADPGSTSAGPGATTAGAGGASRTDLFADPDVAAERMGWRLATLPQPAGPSVFRQFLSLLAVVAVLGGVVYWQHRPKPTAADRPAWASEWDPKVVDLVRFVETSRGLTFEHPVAVDFVPADEFDAAVRKDNAAGAASASASASAADAAGPHGVLLAALGLSTTVPSAAPSITVPSAAPADPQAGGGTSPVIGRYEPWTRHIRIRGADLTPEVRPTLVHELTHALQDQHFDLAALQAASATNGSAAALRAAAEGDAVAVEHAYTESLAGTPAAPATTATTAGAPAEAAAAAADLGAVAVDRPEDNVAVAEQVLDYDLAVRYVEAVVGRGGRTRRDELFQQPEASEASVLFPERQLLNIPLVDVGVPKVDKGDKVVKMHGESNDVGPYLLSVALVRAKLPALAAFELAKGWAGDAFVAFRRDGAPCARIAVQALDRQAQTAVRNGLTTWAATRPAGLASVTNDATSGVEILTACGSGESGRASSGAVPAAPVPAATPAATRLSFFELIDLRSSILVEPYRGSATVGTMSDRRCVADEMVRYLAQRDWPADAAGQQTIGVEAGRQAAVSCAPGSLDPVVPAPSTPTVPADPSTTVTTVDPNG